MSERQTPQSHSRAKSTTNKSSFLPSEKKDGGKVSSTNTTANDSQAVVNFNRQQRYSQNNNPNFSPSYAKGDKSEQPYYSQQMKVKSNGIILGFQFVGNNMRYGRWDLNIVSLLRL